MNKLLTLLTPLLTLLVVGCNSLPSLPEPATNDSLTIAEKTLDKYTDERIAKLATIIWTAEFLAEDNEPSPNNFVLVEELNVAKALVGNPDQLEFEKAQKRVSGSLELAKAKGDLRTIYDNEKKEAYSLREKLKNADKTYETEKATKQAFYEAKLAEREQELAQEQALRKIEADEARKDKFLYLGGFICLIGTALLAFSPNKLMALEILGVGAAISSIGYIWGTPYFYYIVGAFALLAFIKVALILFKKPADPTTPAQ